MNITAADHLPNQVTPKLRVFIFHSCVLCQDFRILNFMGTLSPGFFLF